MSTERDELAAELWKHHYEDFTMAHDGRESSYCQCGAPVYPNKSLVQHQAEVAIAHRRPRTVTTAAELDAAIIRAFENGENLVLLAKGGWRPYILWEDDRGDLHVTSTPMEDDPERLTLNDIALPATVLHEPTR